MADSDELEFWFPHEVARIPYTAPAGGGDVAIDVLKKGGAPWLGTKDTPDGTDAVFELDKLREVKFDESPVTVRFPESVSCDGSTKTEPEPKKPKVQVAAKLGINFGKDRLTIAISPEAGVGPGAAAGGAGGYIGGASGGQGGNANGTAKPYSVTPVAHIEALLKSEESIVIMVRFILRYLYHLGDAVNLSIDYFRSLPQSDPDDLATGFLGWYWWQNVFSIFAIKDTLYDIVNDHADFVVKLLENVGVEFKLDLNSGGTVQVLFGGDLNVTICGRSFIPLGVVLSPIIEFLMAGSPGPPPDGGTIADKIIPRIEGVLENRVVVSLGAMPNCFTVESKGELARAKLEVPKGSPLRKKIERLGHDVAKAADHYKNSRLKSVPDELVLPRLILDLIDHEVKDMVKMIVAAKTVGSVAAEGRSVKDDDVSNAAGAVSDGADAAVDAAVTAIPYVQKIMDVLRGKNPAQDPPEREEVKSLLHLLREKKVHGVAIGVKGPCVVEDAPDGDRKVVVLHVDDDEKATIEPSAKKIEKELETVTLRIPLPSRPQAIGWDHQHDYHLKKDFAGVVAGFDHEDDLRALESGRPAGWVDDALARRQWPREGRLWAWVESGLPDWIQKRELGTMPDLELDEATGDLLVTFDDLKLGTIADSVKSELPLFANASIARKTIWKATLFDDATREEAEDIKDRIDRNQPDEDPYATPLLDDLLDDAASADPSAPTDGLHPRFDKLGRGYDARASIRKHESGKAARG